MRSPVRLLLLICRGPLRAAPAPPPRVAESAEASPPHRRWLTLGETAIGDATLKTFAGLVRLEELGLWRTRVTAEGVLVLRKPLPRLEVKRRRPGHPS